MTDKELEFIGFFAGEGSLYIQKSGNTGEYGGFSRYFIPVFRIYLRKDDKRVLQQFKEMFGGSLCDGKGRRGHAPSAQWSVRSKTGCWKVLRLLEKSSLPFVKFKQLPLMREFLELYSKEYSDKSLERMKVIKESLSQMKKYSGD